jgi:hypothetical protein
MRYKQFGDLGLNGNLADLTLSIIAKLRTCSEDHRKFQLGGVLSCTRQFGFFALPREKISSTFAAGLNSSRDRNMGE